MSEVYKNKRIIVFVLSLLTIIFLGCLAHPPKKLKSPNSPKLAGIDWEEVQGNPVLTGGDCFSWRCAGVGDPTIDRGPDGSIYCWITTMGIRQDSPNHYVSDGPWIGRAKGTLSGSPKFSFSPEKPIIGVGKEGSWDRYIETPTIRFDKAKSRWTAWYMGYAGRGGTKGAEEFVAPALGQMNSLDAEGLEWQHPELPIYRPSAGAWDAMYIGGPTVIKGPDGLWRLYYSGAGLPNGTGIGLLTSTDGQTWNAYPNNPVIKCNPKDWDEEILEQAVAYYKDQYWIWYSAYKRPLTDKTSISIGVATSIDGINWTKYSDNPVINPGSEGSWNDLSVLAPDVRVEDDGTLLMFAYGRAKRDIGKNQGSVGIWKSR